MNKVYCLGEALIDMISDVPHVGGAPANVAACVGALGGACAFIGGISSDEYGKLICRTLAEYGVDMTYAKVTSAPTAIAYVTLTAGERKFRFDRQNTADLSLTKSDIARIPFKSGDILHFCSNCLMDEGARKLHTRLIREAKEAGATVSYDVNLRPSLWQDEQTMLETARAFLPLADIVKASEEEKAALFKGYAQSGADSDARQYPVGNMFEVCSSAGYIIETKGADGACAYVSEDVVDGYIAKNDICRSPALNDSPVDTTGAGD